MERPLSARHLEERRAWARRLPRECHWLRSLRCFPGRDVELIDLSRGGALVESSHRLTPGVWLQTKLTTDCELLVGRAQVLRCQVARLDARDGITYRAALRFERLLTLQRMLIDQTDG